MRRLAPVIALMIVHGLASCVLTPAGAAAGGAVGIAVERNDSVTGQAVGVLVGTAVGFVVGSVAWFYLCVEPIGSPDHKGSHWYCTGT